MEVGKTLGGFGVEARRAQEAGDQEHSEERRPARGQEIEHNSAEADLRELTRACIFSTWVAGAADSLRLRESICQLAERTSHVLVRGESGTGKDLVSELLHYAGPNPDEPLVKIDCTKPAAQLETELFGLEQNGLTRRGRLEMAGCGTLVLDEIAALPMPAQARMLAAIEERRFERPGSRRTVPMNARVIALTAVDLERAVARRTFREDLYFRLQVAVLSVPPLRERPADIRPLAEHFISQVTEVHRRPDLTLSAAAMSALEAYSYPGNVRELRNIVERCMLSATAPEILVQDLPSQLRDVVPARTQSSKMSLEQMERQYIAEVLDFTCGRKSKAAAILGISRKTLLEKRKRYGLG